MVLAMLGHQVRRSVRLKRLPKNSLLLLPDIRLVHHILSSAHRHRSPPAASTASVEPPQPIPLLTNRIEPCRLFVDWKCLVSTTFQPHNLGFQAGDVLWRFLPVWTWMSPVDVWHGFLAGTAH